MTAGAYARALGAGGSPWIRRHRLSRTHGNYPGHYGSDWRLDFADFGPMFPVPAQHSMEPGCSQRPNTRAEAIGIPAHRLARRIRRLLLLASGTPRSEYGAIPGSATISRVESAARTLLVGRPQLDFGIRAADQLPMAWLRYTWPSAP